MNASSVQWPMQNWSRERILSLVAKSLIYLLVALVAWQLARLVLLALSGPVLPPANIPPLPEWRSANVVRSQGLAQWHLFGEAKAELDLSALYNLPDTPLALTLHGIAAATAGDEGYAFISDERGREDVYRRGDEVPGGAKVVAIQPDQVILERNGQRETLRLPGHSVATTATRRGSTQAGGAAPVNTPTAIRIPGIRAPAQPLSITAAVPRVSGLRLDASALAGAIQVAPVASGGFRVFPGRNARIFTQLGLQANDVVTQLNGRPLTSQADAMAIFQQVQQGQSVTITVRRGDRDVILKPDISRLTPQQ